MAKRSNMQMMQEFGIENIPNLDTCVLAALDLFSQKKVPKIKIAFKRPLVVGSGNAAATGKIIFRKTDALFADESNVAEKLKNIKAIDGVVLISASGGKHAPGIAELAKKYKKKITLITNTKDSLAEQWLSKMYRGKYTMYVFPKNREPYTYNTSTYMGMVLGESKEDPVKIKKFIESKVDKVKLPNFAKYQRYYFIIPDEFEGSIRLLNVKFIELFGRNVSRDIETFSYVRHATTIAPAKNELFISFGKKYTTFGKNHLTIPLPKNAGYGAMMAIGYYVVGKIQKKQIQWFKENIDGYTKKVSKIFGQKIKTIVE